MNNKLIMSLIGIAVGIILVGGLLVPTIQDTRTAYEDVYFNGPESPTVNYASYSTNADFDVSISKNGSVWTLAGIDINTGSNGAYLMTDNAYIILSPIYGYNIHGLTDSMAYVSLTIDDWNGVTTAVTSITIDVTPEGITVSDVSATQDSYFFPSTYTVYSDLEGDRVICTGAKETYIKGIEDVISVGFNPTKFFWSSNGNDSKVVYNTTLYDSSLKYSLSEVSEEVSSLAIGAGGDFAIEITLNGSPVDLVPSAACLPKEAIQPVNTGALSIISAIPLIVIVALMMSAVGIITGRSD